MYLGIITSWLGQPFLLGSWLSLILAAMAIGIILLRTSMEDRTLIAELSGYAGYPRQVRYRLLRGVW